MAKDIPISCAAASGVTIDFSNILIKAICPEPKKSDQETSRFEEKTCFGRNRN